MYERSSAHPIGTAALNGVDYRNRKARFGIGGPEYRNRGCGTETARLMLGYAFGTVGLHNVMFGAFGFDQGAIRAYKKAGRKR